MFSIRLKLNDVIGKDEQVILENIQRCSKLVGTYFQVVFWHENLTEKDCKNFVKRNEKLLFEVNTKITKRVNKVWFLIDSKNERGQARYRFDGEILKGIVQYLEMKDYQKKNVKILLKEMRKCYLKLELKLQVKIVHLIIVGF